MAAGRWEFGTAQLGNLLAAAFDRNHVPVNPFTITRPKTEAERQAESKKGFEVLREAAKEWAAAYRRKHGVTLKEIHRDGPRRQ